MFVYRTNGTRFQPGHTQTIQRSGRKSIPVWAWFSAEGAGAIHKFTGRLTGEKYVQILEDVLVPSAYARFGLGPIRFVQDRSPIHTSRVVTEWFEDHQEFDLLPWPAKGSDLNPIENLWSEMVREMNTQNVSNENALWENVVQTWDNLKVRNRYWEILATSMVNRLEMVREVDGDWTKY